MSLDVAKLLILIMYSSTFGPWRKFGVSVWKLENGGVRDRALGGKFGPWGHTDSPVGERWPDAGHTSCDFMSPTPVKTSCHRVCYFSSNATGDFIPFSQDTVKFGSGGTLGTDLLRKYIFHTIRCTFSPPKHGGKCASCGANATWSWSLSN